MKYSAAMEEALCYGWIDSTVKHLYNGSCARRLTQRRLNSAVAEMNQARLRRLVKKSRRTMAGILALPGLDEWLEPPPAVMAEDIDKVLPVGEAWQTFAGFPEAYRRTNRVD